MCKLSVSYFLLQNYLWFNIGSVDSFERNLEIAQQEMDLDVVRDIPVYYNSESAG